MLEILLMLKIHVPHPPKSAKSAKQRLDWFKLMQLF